MKRRKLNTNKVMGILFFFLLLTLGTCFFLKSDFFYLKEVVINNNKYLSKNEVDNLLNLERDKNIFFYNLKNLENKVKANSYIQNCKIKRKLPDKLIVNIKEKNIIGPLYNGKSYCYMDDKGNFIDEIKTTKDDEIVIYVDYNLSNKSIKFKKESDKKKLITLCTKLKEENILMQIKNIDFKNKSVINLKGETGLVVCLKKDNNIEKNVIKLRNVLIDLKNRKEVYGKVDLTYNDYILYSPYSN